MADNDKPSEPTSPVAPAAPGAPGTPGVPPRRSPGHRGADVKDTVAEMAAKAHEISLEAGSKMAAAMKDVINAAAGLTGFVLESARDLVQFMVRRGQMTQEEADKLIREVEAAIPKQKKTAPPPPAKAPAAPKPVHTPAHAPSHTPSHATSHAAPAAKTHTPAKPAAKKAASKPAAKKAAAKKPAAKKAPARKPAPAKGKKSGAKKARR
ncbi:MAG TPA: hypothetical protein VM099_13090 [Gemmatimonadaceae bacterium]|nr:hypothetical protein [Gemmatimonadaceae bacterium]